MNIEELYEFCISLHGATVSTPFNDTTLVFKIYGKMFALVPLDEDKVMISLKCDPEKAEALRQKYPSVTGAYHMNKKYWNSIVANGEMTDEELKHWICHSVDEVLRKLPKKLRDEYYAANSE